MVASELELAIENYGRSIELNPDNTNGTAMLGRIRGEMGGTPRSPGDRVPPKTSCSGHTLAKRGIST